MTSGNTAFEAYMDAKQSLGDDSEVTTDLLLQRVKIAMQLLKESGPEKDMQPLKVDANTKLWDQTKKKT
jgi:hypothetical protein